MLELVDFSAIFQVIIAFYAVYVVEGKSILNTFIYQNVKDDLLKLGKEANRQYKDSQEVCDAIKRDFKKIDGTKLSKPQTELINTSVSGAEQDVQLAKSLKDLIERLTKKFVGETYFSVLSMDMVILCFLLMVLGALDCKSFFCVDVFAGILVLFVILLELHCFLYQFSTRIRKYNCMSPNSMWHIFILFIVCVCLFLVGESSLNYFLPYMNIESYMSWFAIASLLPPVLEVGRNKLAINKMKEALREKDATRTFALDWFKRDIDLYVKMYGKDND